MKRNPLKSKLALGAVLGIVGVALVLGAVIVRATPPVGVTPTLLARGTYEAFHVRTDPHSLIDFQAKAKSQVDVVVRQHDYDPNGSTGWHQHPGPVFITVVSGTLTFYEANDPTCTPHFVTAGEGYVDDGRGHIGRNETGQPAKDISVILAPVNLPFRTEIDPPGNCPF
jgi:hypothetical protein